MAWMATTWEKLNCISTAKPAFLLSIGVAAALAFLFHRFVFRERNPARYEVPVPAELSPSYAWDLTCLQDGTAVEAEVSRVFLVRMLPTEMTRCAMERYIRVAQQTAVA